MFTRRFTYLILLTALLAACATKPAPAPTEIPPAEAPPMVSTIPVLPTVDVRPTPESPAASNAWSQYRDARYGIGVAYPCWWVMYPMPSEGNGATLSLRSFDDAFFRANSVKGQWKGGIAPEGVFAVDFVVFEGVGPANSNAEAYPIDPSMTSIVSSEDKLVGQNQATVIQLKDLVNGDAPLFTVILFRLGARPPVS